MQMLNPTYEGAVEEPILEPERSLLHRHFPVYGPMPDAVKEALRADFVAGDWFFFKLFLGHWLAATLLVSLSHGTYVLGFVGGGAIVGLSYLVTRYYSGTLASRAINSACMMLFSALFIQQAAGRIELHFHVFSGLAMLSRYKDVLATIAGAGTIAVHHLAFNYCQQFGVSVFGNPIVVFDYGTGLDIVLIHAGFVVLSVVVNGRIINISTDQFIEATEMAEENRLLADVRDKSLHEAEAVRIREHAQAEALSDRVDELLAAVDDAATGNLATAIPVQGSDAIGRVGHGLSGLFSDLKDSIGSIARHAETLGEASGALSDVSTQLEQAAQTSSHQASDASSQATDMDAAIQTVASSAVELSASITQVSSQAERALEVTDEASRIIERSSGLMAELSQAGQEIGNVMQMINKIAAQTNLLALNATIEAASAGDAGRGFAVVASEVKTLAVDTGKATENVRGQVEAIQSRTREAAQAMADVERVMAEVRDGSRTIAGAAHHQQSAAEEISQSVARAASASHEINAKMKDLGATAMSTSSSAVETRGSASQLVDMATGLRALVERFRVA